MSFEFADRLSKLPPYLFARLDKIKSEEAAKGRKLISLSIGDPDLPTPDFVIDRLIRAARNPANHQYPSYWGMKSFRESCARFMERRFGVSVNAENEALALIGSKEGIAHIPFAFVNPGEGVLMPDPGYPVYYASTIFAGGVPMQFKLRAENQFLPDFSELEALIKKGPKAKLLFLNYPNNPTSAVATKEFFAEAIRFAKKHGLLICHDNAYSELYFDRLKSPSILELPGAMETCIEFHSLSKTFNMTGWRVGFCVGNARAIEGLAAVKTNVDSGIFNACQEAGIAALDEGDAFCEKLRATYQERRTVLTEALRSANLIFESPKATFYVWAKLPPGIKSEDYVLDLIRRHGIVATPGNGFGSGGEGYVRFTLCSDVSVLKQVAELVSGSI